MAGLDQSQPGAASGIRSGQDEAEGDRQLHVRRRRLQHGGAVGELDHRVHDRRRVDHHVDAVEADVEQQVGLDDFQALVDQGGRVDRDDRSHVPRGVGGRLLGRHVDQLLAGAASEGPAAGGHDETADVIVAFSAQGLRQRRVLGVDRDELAGLGRTGDQLAADDQRLLVGQRQGGARLERSQRGQQSDGAGHAVEHHVARRARDLDSSVGASHEARDPVIALVVSALLGLGVEGELDVLRGLGLSHADQRHVEGDRLFGQEPRVVAARGQSRHLEAIGVGGDDLEGLGSDRSGGAENGDTLAHAAILPHVQQCSVTSPLNAGSAALPRSAAARTRSGRTCPAGPTPRRWCCPRTAGSARS